MKLGESALFSGLYIWFKSHQIRRHLNFRWGRSPLLSGFHVTCDGHFRTRLSYSSQKSCVKIWYGLVEVGGMWTRGAEAPYRGGYMWPAMPIFELGRPIPVKSHVWKFCSDWLNLSSVIVSTNIKKKKKKNHRRSWKHYPSEKFFSGWIRKKNHRRNWKQYSSEKLFSGRINKGWKKKKYGERGYIAHKHTYKRTQEHIHKHRHTHTHTHTVKICIYSRTCWVILNASIENHASVNGKGYVSR